MYYQEDRESRKRQQDHAENATMQRSCLVEETSKEFTTAGLEIHDEYEGNGTNKRSLWVERGRYWKNQYG